MVAGRGIGNRVDGREPLERRLPAAADRDAAHRVERLPTNAVGKQFGEAGHERRAVAGAHGRKVVQIAHLEPVQRGDVGTSRTDDACFLCTAML